MEIGRASNPMHLNGFFDDGHRSPNILCQPSKILVILSSFLEMLFNDTNYYHKDQ